MAGRACLQAVRRALSVRTNVPLQQIAGGTRQVSSVLSECCRRSDTLASKSFSPLAGCFPDCRLRWMSSGSYSDEYPASISQDTREEGDGEVVIPEEYEENVTSEEGASNVDLALAGVPRRKQRFLLQKALKIKSERDEDERSRMPRGFEMKVIDVNRTVKVTKGGKVQSFAAVVICGNHNGVVGYGKGKSSEVGPAIDKASMKALENLHYFDRYHGHTIFHEHNSTFEKTKIYLWPAMSGTGMKASHTVGGILRLAGYQNVKSKVIGSRHPLNTVKAVFQALSEIESPEEVAERRGRAVVESHLLT
ncbi:hypothetical protein R1sor_013514 [Riccia sorocarpa]|uniref:S5 DRBM domain-containing protein n=1 Tax=Riccia sorocarpa TaxID=122646 RepID=A0ABD3HA06_9MARC